LGLLVPETAVAYQILVLNIEKAHNLRERAIGVVRMYRDLVSFSDGKEADWALEFEEPALFTLGLAYQKRPRLSGGAYPPLLRKTDARMPGRLQFHQRRAAVGGHSAGQHGKACSRD
jgi:ParB family chromosome partitioning protein